MRGDWQAVPPRGLAIVAADVNGEEPWLATQDDSLMTRTESWPTRIRDARVPVSAVFGQLVRHRMPSFMAVVTICIGDF